MESRQFLIDTNVVLDYLADKLPLNGMSFINRIVDTNPNISVISKIELLGYKQITPKGQELLSAFVLDTIVLELTAEVVDKTIDLRSAYKIEIPDAIIAATALCDQLKLVTRNTFDFRRITGLFLLNPHNL